MYLESNFMNSLFWNWSTWSTSLWVSASKFPLRLSSLVLLVLHLQSNHVTAIAHESVSSGHLQSQYNSDAFEVKLVRVNKTFPGILHLRICGRYEKAHSWVLFRASVPQVYRLSLFMSELHVWITWNNGGGGFPNTCHSGANRNTAKENNEWI